MVGKSSQTSDGVKLTLFRQIPRQSARWLPARSVDTQNHPSFWFHFSRSQHHVGHVNYLCQSPCRRSSLLLLLRCSPLRTIVHTEPQHQDQLCRFIIDCVREAAGGCFCSTQPTASWSDNTNSLQCRPATTAGSASESCANSEREIRQEVLQTAVTVLWES